MGMTRRLGVAALSVLLAGTTAIISTPRATADQPAPTPASPVSGYELNWSDEFEGSGLDTTEWLPRTGERILCSNDPDNVTVSGGMLRIALEQEERRGMPVTCGGAITKRWLGYGYYETRAKLWSDRGFHSSFWQMGLSPEIIREYTGPFNQINEIDGFEIDSHDPGRVASNTHLYLGGHTVPGGVTTRIADSGADYHVYGWEWTPTHVTFFVDGQPYGSVPYVGPHALQNVWLTSLGFTPPVDATNLPGEVTFDYFRYYSSADVPRGVSRAVLVDDADRGYTETGDWTSEANAFGYDDRTTRRTTSTTAAASWTPNRRLVGDYEVYAWNPAVHNSSARSAEFTVEHADSRSTVAVDQIAAGQQWVPLGAHRFTATAPATVSVRKTGTDPGALRTDSVMFVPATVTDDSAAGGTQVGSWATADVRGYAGGSAQVAAAAGASSTWTIDPDRSGPHDLYAWLPRVSGASDSARYEIALHRNGSVVSTRTVDVDQSGYDGEWAYLGTENFSASTVAEITLTGSSGQLVADAVRAVRNDPVDTSAPAPASGLTARTQVHGADVAVDATFTWTPSSSADVVGYDLYLDGVKVNWQTVRGTRFTVPSMRFGHAYQVQVRAIDSSGNQSDATGRTIPMPADRTAPAAPTKLQFEPLDGGGMLSWSGIGSTYDVFVDGVKVNTEPVTTPNHRVTGLPTGSTHTFQVSARDYSGNESPRSEALSGTVVPAFLIRVADPGLQITGSWTGSGIAGWAGTATMASNDPTATARWSTTLPEAGRYEVWAWIPNHANSTTAARYAISHAGGSTDVTTTQQSGGMDWVSLGSYDYDAGPATVTLSNAAGSGWLRASAVKLVRQG